MPSRRWHEGGGGADGPPLFRTNLGQGQPIAGLATKSRLPTISDLREFAAAGGLLLSYGPDTLDLWRRRLPVSVDKILPARGAHPAEPRTACGKILTPNPRLYSVHP